MLKNDCLLECGSIHVICGPMFAGKTSELIKRLKNECFKASKWVQKASKWVQKP